MAPEVSTFFNCDFDSNGDPIIGMGLENDTFHVLASSIALLRNLLEDGVGHTDATYKITIQG